MTSTNALPMPTTSNRAESVAPLENRRVRSDTRDHATGVPSPPMVASVSQVPELDPYRLPAEVRPTRYDVRLRPSLDDATFTGTVRIELAVLEPSPVLVLNADELTITSCDVDGDAASWELDPTTERLFVTPASPLAAGTSTLTIGF